MFSFHHTHTTPHPTHPHTVNEAPLILHPETHFSRTSRAKCGPPADYLNRSKFDNKIVTKLTPESLSRVEYHSLKASQSSTVENSAFRKVAKNGFSPIFGRCGDLPLSRRHPKLKPHHLHTPNIRTQPPKHCRYAVI